jgi:hypothetical protein
MFSDDEVELVTRNIEEVLRFHEDLVEDLRTSVIPLGFPMSYKGSETGDMLHIRQKKGSDALEIPLEAAIAVVSKIFTCKVS